jgi:hypothetical protein
MPLGVASRVPVNSDLSMEELHEFSQMDKVSVDEVLNLYSLLTLNQKSAKK